MSRKRKNDPPGARTRYRTERLQQEGDQWYFSTREGTLEGPYDSQHRADEALRAYITSVRFALVDEDSKLALLDND